MVPLAVVVVWAIILSEISNHHQKLRQQTSTHLRRQYMSIDMQGSHHINQRSDVGAFNGFSVDTETI